MVLRSGVGHARHHHGPARPRAPHASAREGLVLTILAHPDASRVGDRCWLGGAETEVSRATPDFGDAGPLPDRFLSRSPVRVTRAGALGVTVSGRDTRTELSVDGVRVDGAVTLEQARLVGGVVLELAERIAVRPGRRALVGDPADHELDERLGRTRVHVVARDVVAGAAWAWRCLPYQEVELTDVDLVAVGVVPAVHHEAPGAGAHRQVGHDGRDAPGAVVVAGAGDAVGAGPLAELEGRVEGRHDPGRESVVLRNLQRVPVLALIEDAVLVSVPVGDDRTIEGR